MVVSYYLLRFSLFFALEIMVEELEELCRRLQLSDKEKTFVHLRKDPIIKSTQEAQYSILFKLLSFRLFNVEAFKGTMCMLWTGLGV